jgi:hypothetical protein
VIDFTKPVRVKGSTQVGRVICTDGDVLRGHPIGVLFKKERVYYGYPTEVLAWFPKDTKRLENIPEPLPTGFVNVYKPAGKAPYFGAVYDTREAADARAARSVILRIACLAITGTVGEGMPAPAALPATTDADADPWPEE